MILLIGLEKTAGALVAAVGAVGAFWIRGRHVAHPLAVLLPHWHNHSAGLTHAIGVAASGLVVHTAGLGIGLAAWAALLTAEAIGIWLNKPWGEFLVIVETASLMPIEAWSLVHHVHLWGVLTFGANAIVLYYLFRRYARRRVMRRSLPTS